MTALKWMIGGEWRAHPARVVIGILAIAVGVALGFAVHLVNASALDRFARGLASVNGDADLRVEARGTQGFDERLYPVLARLPAVAAASPAVALRGQAGGATIDLLGVDVLRTVAVNPALVGRRAVADEEGDAPTPAAAIFDPDAVYLSAAALERTGARLGGRVTIEAAGRAENFAVVGTLPGVAEGRAIALVDIAAAQARFGRVGRLDRIDLKLREGVAAETARAAIAAALPPDAGLVARGDDQRRSDALSRAYRVNLDMLALVALLTGAFLVYSAQSLSVARRRPEFALLRVLGQQRRAVLGQVLVEGLVLGAVGALIGIALGYGLASVALKLLGGDLGSGYFAGADAPPVVFAPLAATGFAALGLAAALLGSALPAREAANAPPAVALKNLGDAVDPRRPAPILPALALLAVGALLALLPAVGELPLFGYVSIALLLAAGIAAMPRLARVLLGPLARRSFASPALDLAVKRLWGAPSQAAIALCGIVASTGLMIAMAVMVESFRGSVDEWLGQVLPADLYLAVEGGDPAALSPAAQARLAAVPGVASAVFTLQRPLRLAPDRPPLMLVVRPDPEAYPLIGRPAGVESGRVPVWISEPAARLYDLGAGDRMTLPIGPDGRLAVQVAGVWRDYARQHGAVVIDTADYDPLTGDRGRGEAAIELRAGADPDATIAAIRRALPERLAARTQIVEAGRLRTLALDVFDRSFAVTYLLEAIAILVGLVGVAATVSAQTIARTREFGMLRHLGVTRGQVVAMLGSEGALLGAVGGVAGLLLGSGIAQVLIHVVNPQSFNWTMETKVPWGLFAGVAGALVIAAAGTAMLAGRRALSFDAVRATREDW